jgi:hypothetical protein
MTTRTFPALDLDYRPAGYFRPQALEDYVLSRVKGALVKARLRDLLASNEHEEVACLLREHGVPEEECRALGSVHPLLMGGNYLPGSDSGEVEIARIFIRSTTGDVTAVYARMAGPKIHYRVVDEYGGDTLQGETSSEASGPLTLGELYDFFTSAWLFHEVLDMNFEGDTEAMLDFFVAESDFYPQLDALCRVRVVEAFPVVEEESE